MALVRARIRVGDHDVTTTVTEQHAEQHDLEVLTDEPLTDVNGQAVSNVRTSARSGRPAKPKTTVSTEAAKKKAGESADSKKE